MTILKKVEDAIDYIHNLPRLGSQLSLSRIKELLELMGNPQDELKFVHIAGTNGKGTMASMCSMALTNAGYITGTYTSPFITEFRERFRVNGKMIKRPVLLKIAKSMMPYIEILEEKEIFVTEFEFITALAFEFFKLEKCEIVCLEVGIGGKFDSTNVIKTPEVAVLTSISYDHTDLLGDTLTQIANKKCGIIKENTAVVTVPFQEKEVIEVITKKCNETSSELIIPDVKNICITKADETGSTFTMDNMDFKTKLIGTHQIYNGITMFEVMKQLNKKGFHISLFDMRVAMSDLKMPARFEKISREPLIYLDGGHNKQAGENLAKTLNSLNSTNKVALIGMMADKDYDSFVKAIAGSCKAIVTVPVESNTRTLSADALAATAKKYSKNVFACQTEVEGIQKMVSLLGENESGIICGSFYLASDVRTIVRLKRY